ncbi:MAG: aminotransferase class I/II-fold pyridoxal phosphate-dependent enzyme [Oscillospiraceae bacterium]
MRTQSTARRSASLSLAGERVGYLAVAEQVAEHDRLAVIAGANRALGYINVSSMFQLVAAECVGKTADLSIYEANRNYLYRSLTELGYRCVRPDGAFYLFQNTGGLVKWAMECDLLRAGRLQC